MVRVTFLATVLPVLSAVSVVFSVIVELRVAMVARFSVVVGLPVVSVATLAFVVVTPSKYFEPSDIGVASAAVAWHEPLVVVPSSDPEVVLATSCEKSWKRLVPAALPHDLAAHPGQFWLSPSVLAPDGWPRQSSELASANWFRPADLLANWVATEVHNDLAAEVHSTGLRGHSDATIATRPDSSSQPQRSNQAPKPQHGLPTFVRPRSASLAP